MNNTKQTSAQANNEPTLTDKSETKSPTISPRDVEARKDLNKTKKNTRSKTAPDSKKQKDSYRRTMEQVQGELPTSGRILSRIIHAPFIESLSEIIGSSIARPNAILSGSVVAFVITLSTYLIAKNSGYELSGFETITAFVIGWVIGLIYDYLKAMVSGKKM